VPGEVSLVDVGRALNISQEEAANLIAVTVGDAVKANEVVAVPGGFLGRLRRRARSPVDGQVRVVRKGQILIETAPRISELHAHLRGQVTSIIPDRGAVITVAASLVQGAWGSGGEAGGRLWIGLDQTGRPFRARHLEADCRGTIVVAGSIADLDVLVRGAMIGIAGMVAASARTELCGSLRSAPYPIMLAEGFGQRPLSEPATEIFQASKGREAWLSAPSPDCWDGQRPEVVIPLQVEESPPEEAGHMTLRAGSPIRCLRAPYLGARGIVRDLPVTPRTVESGARLPVAEVELEGGGEPVLVPVANLEMLY
jgi:hypothetical protein